MARKKSSKQGVLTLELVRSPIGTSRYQRKVIEGLGLRRLHHTVERPDTPEIRGMIDKVAHLVEVRH